MSADEYVPSEDEVRGRYSDGAIWQGVEMETSDQHLEDFDAWLARVRRDAARDALDGLIDAWLGKYGTPETQDAGVAVRDYRETNYRLPETEG